MAETTSKVHYPTGEDLYQPHTDMEKLARSIRHIVPVANATERNSLATEYNPTAEKPLYVDRADTGALERNAGDGWAQLYPPTAIAGGRTGSETNSVPNDTITNINTGSSYYYMGGVTGSGSNGGLTVPVTGWYDVDAGIQFGPSSSGYRRIILQVNGSFHHMVQEAGSGQSTLCASRKIWLEAGDTVNVSAWQDSGSTLTTRSNWGFPYLNVALLGQG